MEIILSIFLTLEVKSYLILINIWEIVRILVISEKSDLSTHSACNTPESKICFVSVKFPHFFMLLSCSISIRGNPIPYFL